MDKKMFFDKVSFTKESIIVSSGKKTQTFKLSDFSVEMISETELQIKQIKFSFR